MPEKRRAKLFRNGRNQAVRIPREWELEGGEVLIHRDGDRLVIEPLKAGGLLDLLAHSEPIDEPFPDVDDFAEPLDEPVLPA